MKGFVLVCYNNNQENNVSNTVLENYLSDSDFLYKKNKYENNLYDNVIGYQLYNNNELDESYGGNVLLTGECFGVFNDENKIKYSHKEYAELVEQSDKTEFVKLDSDGVFCVIDEDEIYFQNDITGIKKLFYYKDDNLFILSTSVPFLIRAVTKSWRIRKTSVLSYLCGRDVKWPYTFIDEILVLPPLSIANLSVDGLTLKSITFSELYNLERVNKSELKTDLYKSYKNQVCRREEEKIAVTLSGGYDSNCLTKLFLQSKPNSFTAVSLGYASKRVADKNIYDETVYAEKIAKKLKIPFKRYLINKLLFFELLEEYVSLIDQPGHDPSSNFILNKMLKKDGFELVVNGLGGDANFASKKYIKIAFFLHSIFSNNVLYYLSKLFKFRGPFTYFKYLKDFGNDIPTFYELYEKSLLFSSNIDSFISDEAKSLILRDSLSRKDYILNVKLKSKSFFDNYYSNTLLLNPCEYHASLTAERLNIKILIPFINVKSVLKVINGSHYNNINNREFEMEIFNGIDKDLLADKKSGFSFPYTEWMPPISEELFSYYEDLDYFDLDKDFDFRGFVKKYREDSVFSKSIKSNILIWKLLKVKKFVEINQLEF
jgi:hypothetical protein